MNANKTELNEILTKVRELESRIKNLDVSPNWESKTKNDMIRAIALLDLNVSDFILSLEEV